MELAGPGDRVPQITPALVNQALRQTLTPLCFEFAQFATEMAPTDARLKPPEIPYVISAVDLSPNPPNVGLDGTSITRLRQAESVLKHPILHVGTIPFRPGQLRVELATYYAMESILRVHSLALAESTSYRSHLQRIKGESDELLNIGTFWGSAHLHRVMEAAIITTAQGFAHSTYDHELADSLDPPRWMDTMALSGMLDSLGLELPLNVMGPMTSRGFVFPEPMVALDHDLPVALTTDFHRFLRHEKYAWGQRAPLERTRGKGSAGTGCPVATPLAKGLKTGIDEIALTFTQYFRYYYERSDELSYEPQRGWPVRVLGGGR